MNITHTLRFMLLIGLLAGTVSLTHAQDMPPRHALVELFTNTPCPSCVAQNPGFFSLLSNYTENLHQISFYPGSPYSSCPLYQSNTTQNTSHRNRRGLFGTPRVYINAMNSTSASGVTSTTLDAATSQTSNFHVSVTETAGDNRDVEVIVTPYGSPTVTNGMLYVAIVERDVTLTGIPSNWEDEHHNVFRKFIVNGSSIDLSATTTENYAYTIESEWDASKIYVLAWIEDADTEEALNSGTAFDEPFSGLRDFEISADIQLSPNPVEDVVRIQTSHEIERAEVFSVDGRQVATTLNTSELDVSALPSGSYHVIVHASDGKRGAVRFVKL